MPQSLFGGTWFLDPLRPQFARRYTPQRLRTRDRSEESGGRWATATWPGFIIKPGKPKKET